MSIVFEQGLAEGIKIYTKLSKADEKAALSCEVGNLLPERAKELVLSTIGELRQKHLIVFRRVGTGRSETIKLYLMDMVELTTVIDEALESEEVISIRDPSAVGGCTFDFSSEESPDEPGNVELLMTAWGVHETMIKRLAETLGVNTFRQGTP